MAPGQSAWHTTSSMVAFFSSKVWEDLSRPWALGDTTFLEAYLRTGRVLNITVTIKEAEGVQQAPVLLNYQTHPHVLVRSAFVCSASMPILLNPVQLLQKCPRTGEIRPHSERLYYADGCIDDDIPSQTLAQSFGVHYTVVSQVNPHVTPFRFASHGEAGSPVNWRVRMTRWRGGFLLSAMEAFLKQALGGVVQAMAVLDLLPMVFGFKWNLLFTQNFEGSVTLSNTKDYLWKLRHALANPSEGEMLYWWQEGRQMAWQKMALLEKRLLPECELMQVQQSLDRALNAATIEKHSYVGLVGWKRREPTLAPAGVCVRKWKLFGA